MYAVEYNQISIISLLLERGGDINIRNKVSDQGGGREDDSIFIHAYYSHVQIYLFL
jgi:hypothetical protein